MRDSNVKPEQNIKYFDKLFTKLASLIIVSGILAISYVDFTHNKINAQTVQEMCLPETGINVSQSNCFSDAPINPVFNKTTTDNVRPPPEIGPTYYANNSNWAIFQTNTNTSNR